MQQQEANLFEYLDKKKKKSMWKTYVNKIITNINLRLYQVDWLKLSSD